MGLRLYGMGVRLACHRNKMGLRLDSIVLRIYSMGVRLNGMGLNKTYSMEITLDNMEMRLRIEYLKIFPALL